MKRLFIFLSTIYILVGFNFSLSAQELVFPPAGSPVEIWKMYYGDYWNVFDEFMRRNHDRHVTFVWDNSTIYVKGIFSDFPDSWIKGSINGKEIIFEQNQLICELDTTLEEPKAVYAFNGIVDKARNYPEPLHISFYPNGTIDESGDVCQNSFTLCQDNKHIRSGIISSPSFDDQTAFWYNTESDILTFFKREYDPSNPGPLYPEIDFPTKILFEKVSGGVSGMTDDIDSSEAATYDLYGRRVDSDNLRPGIYIRNGEKIIVR